MNSQHDINRMIEEAKRAGGGEIPLLDQQVPVFHGLPVNGGVMTLDAIEKLTDRQFRELFIAAVVALSGGIYVPLKKDEPVEDGEPSEEADKADEVDPED